MNSLMHCSLKIHIKLGQAVVKVTVRSIRIIKKKKRKHKNTHRIQELEKKNQYAKIKYLSNTYLFFAESESLVKKNRLPLFALLDLLETIFIDNHETIKDYICRAIANGMLHFQRISDKGQKQSISL